ncbi:hypothetical protein GOP47_0000021, partial [Adiantum capillus-veneris]
MRTAIASSTLQPLLNCSCPSVISFSRRGRSPRTTGSRASSMDASFTQKPSTSRLVPNARRTLLAELQDMKDEKNIAGPLEYELPLRIALYPDPKLRATNKRITVFDEKLEKLAKEMFEVMYETDGVGLSAPQVGVNVQLMVFNPEGERGKGEEIVLANPKIFKYASKRTLFAEGCLSFPEIEADVERPVSVKIEAQDLKGKKFDIHLKGFEARIFQHEFDHLQSTLFFERMTPAVLETIIPALQKLENDYMQKTGQPAPET